MARVLLSVPFVRLKIAAPFEAVFPDIVELEIAREPKLENAPLFAPVTVTPDIVKSPPTLMLKILKFPLLPFMVRDEAPRPLIVTVPAIPALTIEGSAETRVMVLELEPEEKLKFI